jgi:hypothetical protein
VERLPINYVVLRGAMYIPCRALGGYLVWICRGKKQRASRVGPIKREIKRITSLGISVLGLTQGSKHNFPYVF